MWREIKKFFKLFSENCIKQCIFSCFCLFKWRCNNDYL
nr:MAG TPA: hypothetical protein [Caudoviricetes sp.]